jgi:hypothetical protein
VRAAKSPGIGGPAIYAVDPWSFGSPGKRARRQLLSDDERAQLAKVASIVRFRKSEPIYDEGASPLGRGL